MSQPTVSSKAETLYAAVNDYVGLTRAIIQRMEDRLKYLTSGIRAGSANEQELQNRISALEADLAAKDRALAELRSNMESSTGNVQQANAELANLRRQLAAETAAKTTAETELANLKIEGTSVIAQKQAEIESLKTEGKARIDERDAEIQRLRTEGTAELELRRADIDRLEGAIRDAEQNIVRLQSDIVARTAERDTVMRQLEEERARMATIMVQLDANNNEQQVRKGELQQLQQALAAAQAEVTRLTGELADTSVSLDKTKQLVDQQKTQLKAQSVALSAAEQSIKVESGPRKRMKPSDSFPPPPPSASGPSSMPPPPPPASAPEMKVEDVGIEPTPSEQQANANISIPVSRRLFRLDQSRRFMSECNDPETNEQLVNSIFESDILGPSFVTSLLKHSSGTPRWNLDPGTPIKMWETPGSDNYGIVVYNGLLYAMKWDSNDESISIDLVENNMERQRDLVVGLFNTGAHDFRVIGSHWDRNYEADLVRDIFLGMRVIESDQLMSEPLRQIGQATTELLMEGQSMKVIVQFITRVCPASMKAGFGSTDMENDGCTIL